MMGGDAYAGVWEHYATLAAINTALWLLSLLLGKTWPVRRTRLSSLSPQLAGLRGEAFRLAGSATALAFFLLQKSATLPSLSPELHSYSVSAEPVLLSRLTSYGPRGHLPTPFGSLLLELLVTTPVLVQRRGKWH